RGAREAAPALEAVPQGLGAAVSIGDARVAAVGQVVGDLVLRPLLLPAVGRVEEVVGLRGGAGEQDREDEQPLHREASSMSAISTAIGIRSAGLCAPGMSA